MKTNEPGRNYTISNIAAGCVATCRNALAKIKELKETIVAEFREQFGAPEPLLRLALNEAEALAWETEYPQLLFPVLAMEKAQSVARWQVRQRVVRSGPTAFAFAA
jgi:hypothetical protein